MKLVIAIINNEDSAAVTSALTREKFIVTKLSTTGGFLLTGNTTLLVGSEEDQVERAEEIIKHFSNARKSTVSTSSSLGTGLDDNGISQQVHVGGATVFVLSVDKMSKY